jgi:hypothetical protein
MTHPGVSTEYPVSRANAAHYGGKGEDGEILRVLYDDPIGGYPKSYAQDGIPKRRCSKARR